MKPLTEREVIVLARQCGMRACNTEEHHGCPYGDESMVDCVERLEADCEAAIKDYIENLPFNGEYTNMALVDVLQQIDGVKIAEFRNASSAKASDPGAFSGINAKVVPAAGYFKADNIQLNMIAYELQREL